MKTCIKSIGIAVPKGWIRQQDAAELVAAFSAHDEESRRTLKSIYKHSHIAKRHSVLLDNDSNTAARQSFYPARLNGERGPTTECRMQRYAAHAGELAAESALNAVEGDLSRLRDVTHLITVSCSGFYAPGVECELITRLNLNPSVRRVHIGFMGCHAALNALSVAKAFCEADYNACVLVTCVELCSLHMQYGWDRDNVMANALFADGAASAIIRSDDTGWAVEKTSSVVLPQTTELIQWKIGHNGFQMGLSPELPSVIEKHLQPWVEHWLTQNGLQIEQVASWAVHPGGPRILQATQHALGLAKDALRDSWDVLAEYGNMSSPTILFILQRLMQADAARPCVALGFGPGLAIEAALIQND